MMRMTPLNRCLNKEIKYYGLSYLGILGAAAIGFTVWIYFGITIGIMGSAIGYEISANIAKYWHSGLLQRFMYWHLPVKGMLGGRYLPESYKRCLL